MSSDDSGLAIAEQPIRALGSLERYGHILRPLGTHEQAWRLEVLDELARAGHRSAGAVARVVGDDDPAVEGLVHELSSAVGLHCDRVVRAVRDRHGPASWRGASAAARDAPPTPYVRRHDGGSRPVGVVTPAGGTPSAAAPAPAGTASDAGPTLRPVVDPSEQRAVIGTAAEVLMSRQGCGVDVAYATILERARDTGTSTYDVAVRVVERGGVVEEG